MTDKGATMHTGGGNLTHSRQGRQNNTHMTHGECMYVIIAFLDTFLFSFMEKF